MTERQGLVTFQGTPLTLLGDSVSVGSPAPDFELLDNELGAKRLSDYVGKTLVVVTVPSLDTPVCDMEARRFNNEAANLGNNVQVVVVSMDLPFAQARWCGAAGIENVTTLSDHRDASLGMGWGLLIKELRLLARAVYVVDGEGKIRYEQIIPEVTNEPDYEAVLAAVKDIAG